MILRPEGEILVTATGTTNVSAGIGIVRVNPASLLATLTINFPAAPSDRDNILIFFGGTITGANTVVTLLTLTASATILGSLPTTALAGTCIGYEYCAATNKWYRLL